MENKQKALEGMRLILSDFHKEAFGQRPRGARAEYLYSLDFEGLSKEFDIWNDLIAASMEAEKAAEQAAIQTFEAQVAKVIALGAGNRKDALRWMYGEEDIQSGQDVEFIVWKLGFLQTPQGRALVQELMDVIWTEGTEGT